MSDFNINLAKGVASSPAARARFYWGMIVYLCVCALGLGLAAYFLVVNLCSYIDTSRQKRAIVFRAIADTELTRRDFDRPDTQYQKLSEPSAKLKELKMLLEQRVQLMPVVHNLFAELPTGVVLQSLSANQEKMLFGLVLPDSSVLDADDPVRSLSGKWEANDELMERVKSIRPVTAERRSTGSSSVFYVQFECVLK